MLPVGGFLANLQHRYLCLLATYAAFGCHCLLWPKATTLERSQRPYLRPSTAIVRCGRSPQQLRGHRWRQGGGAVVAGRDGSSGAQQSPTAAAAGVCPLALYNLASSCNHNKLCGAPRSNTDYGCYIPSQWLINVLASGYIQENVPVSICKSNFCVNKQCPTCGCCCCCSC